MKYKIIFTSITGMIAFTLLSFKSIKLQEQYDSISKIETNFNLNNKSINQSKTALSCTKCHDCKIDESLEYENQKSYTTTIDTIKNLDQITKKDKVISTNSIIEEWNNDENPDNFKF